MRKYININVYIRERQWRFHEGETDIGGQGEFQVDDILQRLHKLAEAGCVGRVLGPQECFLSR
ncbi:MAG TPA: hypothetical protein VG227_10070, partial [Caulobacteraceae bacterium]|nr:hypothetical protein [Caulobacteraceae bacterium]